MKKAIALLVGGLALTACQMSSPAEINKRSSIYEKVKFNFESGVWNRGHASGFDCKDPIPFYPKGGGIESLAGFDQYYRSLGYSNTSLLDYAAVNALFTKIPEQVSHEHQEILGCYLQYPPR